MMATYEDVILNRFREIITKNKDKKRIQFVYNYHTENNYKQIETYKIDRIINELLGGSVTSYGVSCNGNTGRVHISIIQDAK